MISAYLQKILAPVVERSISKVMTQQYDNERQKYESLERLRGLVVAVSLKKMFEGSHFSICTVQDCLKAVKIIADGDTMEILQPLHCVDWAKMPPELRNEVFHRIMKMFGCNG